MLHFGTKPRYILHASNSYGGWLLYQILTNQPFHFWDIITSDIAIITQIWHGAKCILYASVTHGTWLLYQIWTKSTHSSWDITTNTQNLWKNRHDYSNLAQSQYYFTCNSSPWCLIMVPNMKKIHAGIMEECVRMDGWMDGQAFFLYSPIPRLQSGK